MIKNTNYIINPSGKFTIWGSFSDSGCVGRTIVVDTYGGLAKVGGGCFSSKNASFTLGNIGMVLIPAFVFGVLIAKEESEEIA